MPGLCAKPIIDLQVSVWDIEQRAVFTEPLERAGYTYVPDPESPEYLLFVKPLARPRTHHVHVCEAGSDQEFRHLAVRDLLRASDGEAGRYGALKRELAARRPHDRLAYIEGKSGYVDALEKRAVEWARSSRVARRT